MPEEIKTSNQEKIEKLLEKNLELTQEIHRISKRVNRHITVHSVLSFVYFLLIVVPIILGVIFLPPLLKDFVNPYLDLLNSGKDMNKVLNDADSANMLDIINQAQKVINENNK